MFCCAQKGMLEVAEEVPLESEGAEVRQRAWSDVEVQQLKMPVRKREPRTTLDEPVPPQKALEMLQEGNRRFADGMGPLVRAPLGVKGRSALVDHGQRPSAIVLGCADSRVPLETIFDCQPGDIFVLRNAGNTLLKSEGSMVGSMEYAVEHLQSKLILVLGHSNCGAIAGATKVMLARKEKAAAASEKPAQSALEVLLDALAPVAGMTAAQLPSGASDAEIAAKAIKVNVFHSMATLMAYSPLIREKMRAGEVQVHGGIYNLKSGQVEFLGQHPLEKEKLLDMHLDISHSGVDGSGLAELAVDL